MSGVMSKSPWLVHVNANSCNGCDIEVLACLTPLYDAERLGVLNIGTPKQADIMLSDTTSAIIEFLLQQKPVVTFCNNKPGDHLIDITEVEKIENAIQFALTRPAATMAAIKDYVAWTHPYYDGKSSGRMIDAAIAFLNKDKSHLKSKPWNLIRKWKVRKLLKYYTLRSYNKPITFKADK